MIAPPNGSSSLAALFWWATLAFLLVAGVAMVRRSRAGRSPVVNGRVVVFGLVAAGLFAGYLFVSAERRAVEGAFVDLVDALGIDEMPGYGGGFFDEAEAECRISGAREDFLSARSSFSLGERSESLYADQAPGVWEEFAQRAEADGWQVRRFVESDQLKLWGQRGDAVFAAQVFDNTSAGLTVTLNDCLGFNISSLESVDGPLREGVSEVDSFAR